MSSEDVPKYSEIIHREFSARNVDIIDVDVRQFPGETILIVYVSEQQFELALGAASEVDELLPDALITVRKAPTESPEIKVRGVSSVNDPRVTQLVELLNERSRTSEHQPSLHYVPDAADNLNVCLTPRHHLVFGRRGVGKTALLVEAKRLLESRGCITLWTNVQTLRSLDSKSAFLVVADRICDLPIAHFRGRPKQPESVRKSEKLKEIIESLLSETASDLSKLGVLIAQLQQMLHLFGRELQSDIYLFFDDIHYLSSRDIPHFLDMVHAVTRDNSVWIKAAGIKHQTRWFVDSPPTGLQIGHDCGDISLDVTLEEPKKAKEFLVNILRIYTEKAGVGSLSGFFSSEALDRLVLASGGVPRDFLVLSASAIQVARQRENSRYTGLQDVNEAAGRAAVPKIEELEDDAASAIGSAQVRLAALNELRQFLIHERQTTYFRIDFKDKEDHAEEYTLMQSLMDLRLIHLIHGSLSDKHQAGKRSEVYMLDLSQFSGSRFRQKLNVLDFTKGYLTLKHTGTKKEPIRGNTPKKLQDILRNGPLFELAAMSQAVRGIQDGENEGAV